MDLPAAPVALQWLHVRRVGPHAVECRPRSGDAVIMEDREPYECCLDGF
jgi:hypothetical protein